MAKNENKNVLSGDVVTVLVQKPDGSVEVIAGDSIAGVVVKDSVVCTMLLGKKNEISDMETLKGLKEVETLLKKEVRKGFRKFLKAFGEDGDECLDEVTLDKYFDATLDLFIDKEMNLQPMDK